MPVIATETTKFSGLIKHEYEPSLGFTREAVTINDTAQTLKFGTVMGRITASGKWRVALSASADGSQTPAGIFIGDAAGNPTDIALAAATDTRGLVLVRGPAVVADAAMTLGTGITAAAAKTALAALNPPVLVETAI